MKITKWTGNFCCDYCDPMMCVKTQYGVCYEIAGIIGLCEKCFRELYRSVLQLLEDEEE